jgi:phenylalanyl-tRNA synthetase beta chain
MVGLGFLEAKSSPFAPDTEGEVRLSNPLSEREDHLRVDVLTGLLHRLEYNFARGQRDIRLFELGTAFKSVSGPLPEERIRIAAAWTGRRTPLHWSGDGEGWDIWDLKSMLTSIASLTAEGSEVHPLDPHDPAGQFEEPFAVTTADGQTVGWGGRIPTSGLEAPPWADAVWGLEVEVLPGSRAPIVYRSLPSYPGVERDIALVVQKGVLAAEVGAVIRESAPDYLEALSVFDVYEGENIPEGTRSIAWRLRFRSPDRTLTDEEVDSAVKRITSALEERLNVGIRGA